MRAIITVGLGFGDEGKGATVDYLTRAHKARLVVRYSGGSQCGHNVQLADGRRHTFSQFGAGTLATDYGPVRTYLGPDVVVNPPALLREAEHLRSLGVDNPLDLLTIDKRCLLTTFYHMQLNRIREIARGANRHGSCGHGIGEVRSYRLRYGFEAPVVCDLGTGGYDATGAILTGPSLLEKLALLRDRCLDEVQAILGDAMVSDQAATRFCLDDIRWRDPSLVAKELLQLFAPPLGKKPRTDAYGILAGHDVVVFEGAQGVLLDEWFGFPPHHTWSTVTAEPALAMLREPSYSTFDNGKQDEVSYVVLGLTRSYITRHGVGPLPTFHRALTTDIRDPGNPHNEWQGSLRCGHLDLVLLKYAMHVLGYQAGSPPPEFGLVISHLDQIPPLAMYSESYNIGSFQCSVLRSNGYHLGHQRFIGSQLAQATPVYVQGDILLRLAKMAPIVIKAYGPTADDRVSVGLPRFF